MPKPDDRSILEATSSDTAMAPVADAQDIHSRYAEYEVQFDETVTDRQGRRKRKPRVRHREKVTQRELVADLADATGMEAGFETTYQPGRLEAPWLLSSLGPFYEEGLITDVLAVVKGGKEASVYRCQADPNTGKEFLAAKVYRPRQFRNLRNDKQYRAGRPILAEDGSAVRENDHRVMSAVRGKTRFGQRVTHTSWLTYEYETLARLYKAGGAVPRPYYTSGNAILMDYVGDERLGAPTLNGVNLAPDEAEGLFREALRNIVLMLEAGLIHGDLSAFNMLYWEGQIILIDFPQVTDLHTNPHAYRILKRDVERTCQYFARQGVDCDPWDIFDRMWRRYGSVQPGAFVITREELEALQETRR